MRLFVAIELPEAWRRAALEVRTALEAALDREAASALRWVAPELLHLTLRFVGEYPDGDIERLERALEERVREVDLQLQLATIGTFGAPRRTRTVWLGLTGDLAGLTELAAAVERAVVSAGVTPAAGRFAPHIAIARVRDRASSAVREAIARSAAGLRGPGLSMAAREVALVRSRLGTGAPRYEVLARHPAGSRPEAQQAPSSKR